MQNEVNKFAQYNNSVGNNLSYEQSVVVEKNKIMEFIRPESSDAILFLMGGMFAAGCYIFIFVILLNIDNMFLFCLTGVFFAAIVILLMLKIHISSKRATDDEIKGEIERISNQGNLSVLFNDFEAGGMAFGGALRLGQEFLIGRRSGKIVQYCEIIRIYQYIHKTNFVEDSRKLVIETVNNKKIDLCCLPLRGKGENELRQVLGYIISRNNSITIGYR